MVLVPSSFVNSWTWDDS